MLPWAQRCCVSLHYDSGHEGDAGRRPRRRASGYPHRSGVSRRPAGGGRGARWNIRVLLLLLVAVAGLVTAAYFPFALRGTIANDVHRTPAGLAFGEHNTAATRGTPAWLAPAVRHDTFDLRLSLRPARQWPGKDPVLAVGQDVDSADVSVWQDGRDLVVHLELRGGGADMWAPRTLAPSHWTDVLVEVRAGEASLRVDGSRVARLDLPPHALSSWEVPAPLSLGGGSASEKDWAGSLRTATVSAGPVSQDYLRPGALHVPASYEPAVRWEQFWPDDRTAAAVDVLHLLAFVPLGALVVLCRRPPVPPAAAVAVTTALGVALVAAKLLFVGRHPGQADLLTQPLGAALGVLFATWLSPRSRRWKAPPSIRPRPDRPE